MKKAITFSLFIIAFTFVLNAQIPNYSEHVAPIIYDNCSSCHHDGGIGEFPLMSYGSALLRDISIAYNVSKGRMPPWPVDDIEGGFVHDRSLSAEEIKTIVDWVTEGSPEGDPSLAPSPPVFTSEYVLGEPDLQLKAPVYTSQGDHYDDYVCFTIPTGLTVNKFVKAIEVIPGNPEIVHHCLIYIELKDDPNKFATDVTSHKCGGPSNKILLGEYIPGSDPIVYPNDEIIKFGIELEVGAKLILAMHYPHHSIGSVDSTKINLHFYPDTVLDVRRVYADAYLEYTGFCIEPNIIDTITIARAAGISATVSIMSFFPHMHLIGKEIRAWAITPDNQYIDLGVISDWDFEWQGFYVYRKLKVVPVGSILYGQAIYDNTTNIANPGEPPVQVCEGGNTDDEMFTIYAQYLVYEPGDENIDLNAILDPEGANTVTSVNVSKLNISPNPVSTGKPSSITVPDAGVYKLRVFGIQGGVVVDEIITVANGQYQMNNNLSPGVYLVTLRGDSHQYVGKLVVQ
jgi:hypothetical protein